LATPALAVDNTPKPPSDATTESARASFQRGVELFHEGNFEAALAEFRKANELAPSYRILYNIAQTCFEVHDYVNALKYYRQYLADGGADISGPRKSSVEELIQKLNSRIAFVEVSVNVEGAQISVDDVPVGISPLDGPIPLNPGARRVSASKAGLAVATRTLTVAGSDKQSLTLTLRDPATLVPGPSDESAVELSSQAKSPSESNAALVTALAATGVCAVTTGVFGWLAVRAKNDFNRDLDTLNVSQSQMDNHRSRLQTFALVTDIAAAATVVSGAVSLYFVLARPARGKAQPSKPSPFVALSPTPTGVALHGGW
jgi:tetratricopeptide (TPR) repeat protein